VLCDECRPWIWQGVQSGLVAGSLFFLLGDAAFAGKFAFFFFVVQKCFFFNLVEGAMAFDSKNVRGVG
jgi:hypothetical protein